MNKKKENCIFISANRSFLKLLKICLFSISQNYPNHPDILLCHTDFTENDLQEIDKITDRIIPISNTLEAHEIWPIMSHLPTDLDSRVFYARFLIRKWWIFDNYQNVLHLDADVLVVKNLDILMHYDEFFVVQESYAGDDKIFKDHNDPRLLQQLKKDAITIWNVAINGWIFLVPPIYRTQKHHQELMYLLSSYKSYIQRADQSIINTRIYKNNIPIQKDFNYNFQHRLLLQPLYDNWLVNAHIIHFNWINEKFRINCMKKMLHLSKTQDYPEKYRIYYYDLVM